MSRNIGFFGQNYISSSGGIDVDAENYINEVLSTGATLTSGEQTTIDNFFRGLKNDGLYTLLDRIYPFIGGNSASNAVEMKAPGTNDLVFYGNWTHGVTGSVSDRVITTYADTLFNVGTNGVTNVTSDFSFGIIKATINPHSSTVYNGVGDTGSNQIVLGYDGDANLQHYFPGGQNLTNGWSTNVGKGGYLQSVWRDSASTFIPAMLLNGATASNGLIMGTTVSGTYTRRSGDAIITLNKLNIYNQAPDEGRWFYSWIGRFMNGTQRTNYLIRINDLLKGFNRNIFN